MKYRLSVAKNKVADFYEAKDIDSRFEEGYTATQTALNSKAPSGFGLGETGVTVADCNNATTSGIFYSPPSDPNRPSGATDGMILVMAYAPNYVIQIHSSWNTGFTFRRSRNVTWSAWVKLATV